LREWIRKNGSKNVVYVDESGFYAESPRPHAYAKRGVKVHGLVTGNKKKGRINLIMAQRGKEWLAPMLFDKSCTCHTVNAWVEQALLKELRPNSLIIMDNAPVHNKTYLAQRLQQHGHTLMPLPRYSPDFNPIEQSFAIIKKQRTFSNQALVQLLS
jgi:DDE superfamily endonuclease